MESFTNAQKVAFLNSFAEVNVQKPSRFYSTPADTRYHAAIHLRLFNLFVLHATRAKKKTKKSKTPAKKIVNSLKLNKEWGKKDNSKGIHGSGTLSLRVRRTD